MKPILILNDLHLGVRRVAGTTPESAMLLRKRLVSDLSYTLNKHAQDKDVLVLGDVFDDFLVSPEDLWDAFLAFTTVLDRGHRLVLVKGNHDEAPRGNAKSSFSLLADLLTFSYPDQMTVVSDEGHLIVEQGLIVIPHMPNNDLFALELENVARFNEGYLLTHCNMMPPDVYGKHDHSLSIDVDTAKRLAEHFVILNAHEHQHIHYPIGKGIQCLGNQCPSSVADCLANGKRQADGKKYAWVIDDNGLSKIETWSADEHFLRVDWRDLDNVGDYDFIRVEGTAKAEEAALVVDAIAKLRGKHSGFVISNAVQIDGQEGLEEAAQVTFDNVKGFDVMSALLAELEPEERKVIEGVMGC